MKNIIIVGVLDKPSSSNIWMATSLTRLGYNVIPINYRTIVQKYGRSTFENALLKSVEKYNPYLVIFCKCNGISSEIVRMCSEKTLTWLWFMDSQYVLQQLPEVIQHAKYAHFTSSTCIPSNDVFVASGVKRCFHIFEGVEPTVHYPTKVKDKYRADISFVGSETQERDRYKKLLEGDGRFVVKFYGPDYSNEWIDETKWCEICSASNFILSVGTFNEIPFYFPGRVFEALGAGACLLHYDPTGTMNLYFEHGKDLFLFRSDDELISALVDMDWPTQKAARDNGRKKVLDSYTWDHSMSKMLDIVERYNGS